MVSRLHRATTHADARINDGDIIAVEEKIGGSWMMEKYERKIYAETKGFMRFYQDV